MRVARLAEGPHPCTTKRLFAPPTVVAWQQIERSENGVMSVGLAPRSPVSRWPWC